MTYKPGECLECVRCETQKPCPPHGMYVVVEPGYEPLAEILVEALNQAQHGKGKVCHANNKPFLQQPIITEGREIGVGGHVFQIRKKVREAANCEDDERAITDMLGAINYTAAMVILRREAANNLTCQSP